jgi:hypothetical protein
MSRWLLLGISSLIAAPLAAQSPEPAPMPRSKNTIALEWRFDLSPRTTACTSHECCESASPGRLSGTWYREQPGLVAAFKFTNDELTVTIKAKDGDGGGTVTLTAGYAVTKDGTVHGVFTGADIALDAKADELNEAERTQMATTFQSLVDQPFAFRCRKTESGLMISGLRMPETPGLAKESLTLLCGKFTVAEKGNVPAPKLAAKCSVGRCELGMVLPDAKYLQHQPLYFPNEPVFPLPRELATQSGPVLPPPPEVQAMMAQTLNRMMGVPVMPAGLNVEAPGPALAPLPLAAAEIPPVGTWTRQMGPLAYKLEVKENHLTLTLTTKDGPMTVDYVLTADYYPTRTAGEIIGIVTSFDMSAAGLDDKEIALEIQKTVAKVQKSLCNKPLALTFRVSGDSLVIGNVRMPDCEQEDLLAALEAMGGKYKSATRITPAVPATIPHCEQACPVQRIGVDFNFDPPRRIGYPPMPLPEPLPTVKTNPWRGE